MTLKILGGRCVGERAPVSKYPSLIIRPVIINGFYCVFIYIIPPLMQPLDYFTVRQIHLYVCGCINVKFLDRCKNMSSKMDERSFTSYYNPYLSYFHSLSSLSSVMIIAY